MAGDARGFTLIELLLTMVLIAVLAALALPGYSQAMQRALRQDARLALLAIQHRQERHFSEHHVYADTPGPIDRSSGGLYLLSVTVRAAGSGYLAIARADPLRRQAGDRECALLSIDETGQRRSADAAGNWRDDDVKRCWG